MIQTAPEGYDPHRKGVAALKKQSLILCLILTAAVLNGCGTSQSAESPAAAETAVPTSSPASTSPPTAVPSAEPSDTPAPTPIPTPVPTPTPSPVPTLTPIPTSAPTPEGPAADPVEPGKYTYRSAKGKWTLSLRADGLFVLTDPNGVQHPGESWITEDDGTVTCGPTDIYDAEFAFAGGCSRWMISGKNCEPVFR